MQRSLKVYLVLMAIAAPVLIASAAVQPPPPSDDEVNAIAHQLYCPVCENVPLDVCPTQACAQWRATTPPKLAPGWAEGPSKDYFVGQYGERRFGTPPAPG